jgi:hypothetical protein
VGDSNLLQMGLGSLQAAMIANAVTRLDGAHPIGVRQILEIPTPEALFDAAFPHATQVLEAEGIASTASMSLKTIHDTNAITDRLMPSCVYALLQMCIILFGTLLTYGSAFAMVALLRFLISDLGIDFGMFHTFIVGALSVIFGVLGMFASTALFKYLVLGHAKPGHYRMFSFYFMRWWV